MAAGPSPRSPPRHPDLCGRRRMENDVEMLNREIGHLQEELQSLEGLQPVSRCCKEVNEFKGTNPDPLIPIKKKRRKSCRIWKWLRSNLCFCFPPICCCSGLGRSCCSCPAYRCCGDCQCSFPRCSCCKLSCVMPRSRCLEVSCCPARCCRWEDFCCKPPRCCRWWCCSSPPSLSCPEYSCGCFWSCPRCTEPPPIYQDRV